LPGTLILGLLLCRGRVGQPFGLGFLADTLFVGFLPVASASASRLASASRRTRSSSAFFLGRLGVGEPLGFGLPHALLDGALLGRHRGCCVSHPLGLDCLACTRLVSKFPGRGGIGQPLRVRFLACALLGIGGYPADAGRRRLSS